MRTRLVIICITKCARIFAYIYRYDNLRRFINAFFSLFEKKENPYVEAHKAKKKGDAVYQEYLNWLDKNGGDMPLEKLKTKEEFEFEKKLHKAQSEHEIRNIFKRK